MKKIEKIEKIFLKSFKFKTVRIYEQDSVRR
jgi:hypothetical protein